MRGIREFLHPREHSTRTSSHAGQLHLPWHFWLRLPPGSQERSPLERLGDGRLGNDRPPLPGWRQRHGAGAHGHARAARARRPWRPHGQARTAASAVTQHAGAAAADPAAAAQAAAPVREDGRPRPSRAHAGAVHASDPRHPAAAARRARLGPAGQPLRAAAL